MPTQQELGGKGVSLDLLEASLDEGQVRRQNNPAGQIQRMVITDRHPTSPYKVQVILSACVHGYLDVERKKPASLILVDYNLNSTVDGAVFTSINTSFEFQLSQSHPGALAPQVIAYAPFKEPKRFNETSAKESKKHQPSAKVSPKFAGAGAGEVAYAHENAKEHDQKYFDLGQAGRDYDDKERGYRVWWNVIQNRSQKLGIPPQLRLAMLVERTSEEKFQAVFSIAPEGGLGYTWQNLKEKWLRKTTYDDPVIFDPSVDPMLGELEDELVAAGVLGWEEDKPSTDEAGASSADLTSTTPENSRIEPVVVRREENKSLKVQPFEKLRRNEKLHALSHVWGLTSKGAGVETK
ncbi:hypothetical protein FDECE_12058 [Fusarium decemcellulare]|nr:hypothetical protein FDECE_12058 [Fusarium decemcellulare]